MQYVIFNLVMFSEGGTGGVSGIVHRPKKQTTRNHKSRISKISFQFFSHVNQHVNYQFYLVLTQR